MGNPFFERETFFQRESFLKDFFFNEYNFTSFWRGKLSFRVINHLLKIKILSRYHIKKNLFKRNLFFSKSNSSWLWFYYTLKCASKKKADTHHPTSDHNNQIWIRILFVCGRFYPFGTTVRHEHGAGPDVRRWPGQCVSWLETDSDFPSLGRVQLAKDGSA